MKVVTFGELMIRLQPFNYERFVQANNLEFRRVLFRSYFADEIAGFAFHLVQR